MNNILYFFKQIIFIAAVLILICMIVNSTKSESQDNKTILSVMELEEINEIVEIKYGTIREGEAKLLYDKKTNLVYLDAGKRYSNFIPYMKDKNTQYIWNGKTLE